MVASSTIGRPSSCSGFSRTEPSQNHIRKPEAFGCWVQGRPPTPIQVESVFRGAGWDLHPESGRVDGWLSFDDSHWSEARYFPGDAGAGNSVNHRVNVFVGLRRLLGEAGH